MKRFLQAVLMGAGLTWTLKTLSAAESPRKGDDLFDQPRVLQLKLEVPQANLESLKKAPNKYVKSTLREGEKVYAEVGLRIKGSGTFQSVEKKPSLSLKFNEFASGPLFHGHARILLNASAHDASYLRPAIGGELFRAVQVPAPKISYAQVEWNGQDLGLYVIEQAVNRDFLAGYFKKSKGTLYEGANKDVNSKLEQDGGDPVPNQEDLKALVAAAQDGNHENRLRRLATVLDLDRFIAFAAVEVFTWSQSGYTMSRNNYRIYHDPSANRMVFIPHGLDQLFDRTNAPFMPAWKGLVAKAVFETPEGQRRYGEQMAKLLGAGSRAAALDARIRELAEKIRPSLTRDPARTKAFDDAVAQLRERITERIRFIDQQLKQRSPAK